MSAAVAKSVYGDFADAVQTPKIHRLLRGSQIARHNCAALFQPAVRREARQKGAQSRRRRRLAAKCAMTGMVRQQCGGQRPNVEAQTLQREAGGAVTDVAVDDFGLDRKDRTRLRHQRSV